MSSYQQFFDFVKNWGAFSWRVLFVEAPIEDVANQYGKLVGKPCISDVARNAPATGSRAAYATIAKVKAVPWCVINHRMGCRDWSSLSAVDLGAGLDVRAISFDAEDTSGTISCRLYDRQLPTQLFATATEAQNQDEIAEYGIVEPNVDNRIIVDDYGEVFVDYGITLVNLYPVSDSSVAVEAQDSDIVERVDLSPY